MSPISAAYTTAVDNEVVLRCSGDAFFKCHSRVSFWAHQRE